MKAVHETPIGLPQAWTSESAGSQSDWMTSLPDDLIEEFIAGEHGELDAPCQLLEKYRTFFEASLVELNQGRGFILLDRLPTETLTQDQCRRAYWRIGQSLGTPVEQNIEGTLLYDVWDTGQSVGKGARFSVTNAESSFHTDAAFADQPPEFVGLLSLQSAVSGGESQLVSACTIHNHLLKTSRPTLDVLYRDFNFDRRGQFRPGEPELMVAPVFRWDEGELDTRYLHYYIAEGHRAGDPLDESQEAALEELLAIVNQPEMRVTFSLEPGQMLFTNNHWILHNRKAFQDHEATEQRRHYIRLWLSRR